MRKKDNKKSEDIRKKTEAFKKSEGLAKKVMDVLINNFLETNFGMMEKDRLDYINLIKWSFNDYTECGYNLLEYKSYLCILEAQEERRKEIGLN